MKADLTSIHSEFLAARESFSRWKALPESIRSTYLEELYASGRKVSRLMADVACELCTAEADCTLANPAVDVLGYEKAMTHYKMVRSLADEMGAGPTPADYRALWALILEILNARLPDWRERVDAIGQLHAVRHRAKGARLSDEQIFEAFIKGALTGVGAAWSRIEPVLPYLPSIFHGFSLDWYAGLNNSEEIMTDFKRLGVNGQYLRLRMNQLIGCAGQLSRQRSKHGDLETYFHALRLQHDGSVIQLARMLGSDPAHKLAGFRVPTAAEGLKNCGFDLAKPDQHVNRAIGCFFISGFDDWRIGPTYDAPVPDLEKLVEIMSKMEDMADCVGVETVLVDNVIWLLGSADGLHLPNAALLGLRRPLM